MLRFILATTAEAQDAIDEVLGEIPHRTYLGQASGVWCVAVAYEWLKRAHQRLSAADLLVLPESSTTGDAAVR